jgi:hypothetical protein
MHKILMVGKSPKRSHEMVFVSKKKRPKRAGKPESVPVMESTLLAVAGRARRRWRPPQLAPAAWTDPSWPHRLAPAAWTGPWWCRRRAVFPPSLPLQALTSCAVCLRLCTRLGNSKLLLATGVRAELTSAIDF